MERWNPDLLCISLGAPCDLFSQKDILALAQRIQEPQVYILQCNAEALIKGDAMRRALGPLYRKAARIICVSEANKEMLERQLATDLPNAVVIPNPIRERFVAPLDWPNLVGGAKFATVARYETECKAQDLILKTLSTPLWKERDWHYSLFGGGPDEGYLHELVRYYGLENKVTIRGYERDLKRIWMDHHLHLLVSRAEGLTLALEESMCCGRPALINRAGGNHELLRDGIEGFLSPWLDSESLNETLERAWTRQSSWKQMGISSHKRVKSWVPEELGKLLVSTVKDSMQ
jgi:glycosyltransferase involved in cell wall biosynthesis